MSKLRSGTLGAPSRPPARRSLLTRASLALVALVALVACTALLHPALLPASLTSLLLTHTSANPRTCHTPLPPLHFPAYPAPHPADPRLIAAARKLTRTLHALLNRPALDSLALALVTAHGSLFEFTHGPLRANESAGGTEPALQVDRDTVYRIASVSKLFTTVQTLVLHQRRILNLDDPVTRFLPNFTYLPFGCAPSAECPAPSPITLRQLSTHLSGLARDLPAGTAAHWPAQRAGDGPPPMNGLPFPSAEQALAALARTPQIQPAWGEPVYSNTGWALLGAANVAANRLFGPSGPGGGTGTVPQTHAELLQRDVLRPLGLNGTFFVAAEENRARLAVSSSAPEEVDLDFLDWSNPSGGQFSSLSDLTTLMQSLLDPLAPGPGAILTPATVREWLRPAHAYGDDVTEQGVLWEIEKAADSDGVRQRWYQKFGNLASYHAAFAMNPESGYGIVLLSTGAPSQAQSILRSGIAAFQPALDKLRAERAQRLFGGPWELPAARGRGPSDARVVWRQGALWLDRLVLNGTDTLALLAGRRGAKGRLWWMGGEDFRYAPLPLLSSPLPSPPLGAQSIPPVPSPS
ncbi:beta-lactamase/transpeptidase-like protein [Calocera cornea HHB12733]|uniref:Beta-lactamase/transpeptidase-like protein n=1 Tax=Calocera cornea HHB12733 TaxID=1353952 RepID=A0A165DDG5_9BASI|nr:beta-lactamase/transpeptidase-like protein [Calocera cornea HHB12733]